jgi:hypothetical protein
MPKRHSRINSSRRMRGGSYSSAASYGGYVNGDGNSQWNRTMDQAGAYGQIPGNLIIGAQGQNVTPPSQVPTAAQLALVQKAGGKKKGGFVGEVFTQAIPPLFLWGAQYNYNKGSKVYNKGSKVGGKTRKRRGGFVGPDAAAAGLTPFVLLAAQYKYGQKKRSDKTRRR